MTSHVKITARSFPVSFTVGGAMTSVFDFTGVFWSAADLVVYVGGVLLDPSAYGVTGLGQQAGLPIVGGYGGGEITLNTPIVNTTLVIDRFVQDVRDTDFSATAPLPPDAMNSDLDRLTARDQDLRALIASGGNVIVNPSSAVLSVNGHIGAVFLGAADVGALALTGGALSGVVTGIAPALHDSSTKLVTSAWVQGEISSLGGGVTLATTGTPADLGTAALGTGTHAARDDHVHNLPTPAAIGAAPAVVTTKGDLYTYGVAALRLAVGTNTQILQVDSTQTSGLKWTDFSWANLSGKPATFTPSAHTHVYTDVTNFAAGVIASVVAGSGVTLATVGGQLQISSSGGALPFHEYPAWENGITTGTLAATNVTNLNNLINTLNAGGGGEIVFNAAGAYQIDSTIFLKSKVSFRMCAGAYFQWVGAAGGTIFASPSTDVMVETRLRIFVNEGAAFSGTVFNMHSCMNNDFDFTGLGTQVSTGVFCLFMADSSAGLSPYPGLAANRNFALNRITLQHVGTCGYGMIMSGITSGLSGSPNGATDNAFRDLMFANVLNRGIKINEWSDSNKFSGNTYVGLSSAANSIGIIINEGRTNNGTVYNTVWDHVQVDTFGSLGGRYAVVFQESRFMRITQLFNDPQAENGIFTGTNSTSYYVGTAAPGTNVMVDHYKGWSAVTP